MTAWDIGCVVVGSWTITAVLVAPWIGRAMRDEDDTQRAQYPPPVPAPITPPFMQAMASADWFFGIPSDCLGDDAVRALCDDIERREFS